MEKKTYRAPLALAIVSLFAASLVPVSGADSPTTVYTFQTGGSAPRWTILKLDVTEEGVVPEVLFRATHFHCPAMWAVKFIREIPGGIETYNGFGFDFSTGRHGADAFVETPLTTVRQGVLIEDGATGDCTWTGARVIYGELPLGTVYVLHVTAGMRSDGMAVLSVDRPGVQIVDMTSGNSTFYWTQGEFGRGVSASVFAPPFCGAPTEVLDCHPSHFNEGGDAGLAAVGLGKSLPISFKDRPFWGFRIQGFVSLSNASVAYPTGVVKGTVKPIEEVGPWQLNSGGLDTSRYHDDPRGRYEFRVDQSVSVGNNVGWHVYGADLRFPGDR